MPQGTCCCAGSQGSDWSTLPYSQSLEAAQSFKLLLLDTSMGLSFYLYQQERPGHEGYAVLEYLPIVSQVGLKVHTREAWS